MQDADPCAAGCKRQIGTTRASQDSSKKHKTLRASLRASQKEEQQLVMKDCDLARNLAEADSSSKKRRPDERADGGGPGEKRAKKALATSSKSTTFQAVAITAAMVLHPDVAKKNLQIGL